MRGKRTETNKRELLHHYISASSLLQEEMAFEISKTGTVLRYSVLLNQDPSCMCIICVIGSLVSVVAQSLIFVRFFIHSFILLMHLKLSLKSPILTCQAGMEATEEVVASKGPLQ